MKRQTQTWRGKGDRLHRLLSACFGDLLAMNTPRTSLRPIMHLPSEGHNAFTNPSLQYKQIRVVAARKTERNSMNHLNEQAQTRKSSPHAALPTRLIITSCIVLATALSLAQPVSPQKYVYKTVDAPGNDFAPSPALITWVNNSGLVVQQYADNDGNYHTAALLSTGWEVIDVPGAIGCGGSNPNSQGEVALSYWGDGIGGLAIWNMGRYTYVPEFWTGYAGTGAQGLNDRGVLAMSVIDSSGKTLALSGNARSYTVFAGPDSDYTIPFMTSDRGVTVGCFFDAEGVAHGFIQDGPQCVTIDVPNSLGTYATGINSQGDIVGQYFDSDWLLRGFLLVKGNLLPFNIPGSRQTMPYCITANGKIAGVYATQDRTWHGFVAEPAHAK